MELDYRNTIYCQNPTHVHSGLALEIILLLLAGISIAYAQSEDVVAGRYSAPGQAFEIEFPEGWSGNTTADGHVVVSRDSASITAFMAGRLEAKDLIVPERKFEGALSARTVAACDSLANNLVDLGDLTAFRSVQECPYPADYMKTESYVILTLTRSIVISYSAPTNEEYDIYVSEFRDSLQTLRVSEPVSFRSLLEVVLGTTDVFVRTFELDGEITSVALATSSGPPAVTFNEEEKRLTIIVDEQKREEGRLLIPVHRFLVGPYQVYVDGERVEDFLEIDDARYSAEYIYVTYGQGQHEIIIIAEEVIPEFGVVVMVILATAISGIIMYHRLGRGIFNSESNPGRL